MDYVNSKDFGVLSNIANGEGFLVNSDVEQTLSYAGTPAAITSHPLDSDWSLIGLKSNGKQSVTELISGNEDDIASIWKWINNTWSVYLPGGGTETYAQSKGFSVLENIDPGEGFWVTCKKEITLE